ncbi:MAG: bifunctional 5,10-methylenetetrahydrofolate dehydrogenase/5,10-methenyltetrahydrofolate cyclohydrolase [Gemmatimonadetes bacterium]|nr:bifunctional 5,10-methylenetetrahydrofolate dehydrogenase/5,10-methenyltetrahydrofolate cyclohydrolase [Gemmatimonadota bacterium]
MAAVVLDGTGLARRRLPMLAARAEAVLTRRGRAPALVLVTFGDDRGHAPHVARKQRMCADAGVDLIPLIFEPGVRTRVALAHMRELLKERSFDGVFVQVPFPDGIDGDSLVSAVPVELDVDIMTPVRTARYMNGTDVLPPVTVSAALLLLDEYDISIEGRRGIVVAEEHPFSLMLRAALVLRGADMRAPVHPADPGLKEHVRAADLVVVAAGVPGLLHSTMIRPGAVAIDAGYFNAGGRGDIDLTGGIDHLAAISPVPGGIGPMTISALLERVVLFAEQN